MVSRHLSFLQVVGLTLGKSSDALGETVFGDELRPANAILRLGRKRGIATSIKIQANHLGQAVAAHVETFAILQALEESELLLVHLEEFGVALPVEGGVFQEEERGAGVDDGVGIRAEIFGGLADHGHAAKVLANRLDRSQRRIEKLLVLHAGEQLFDQDVLGHAKIGGIEEHIVDAAEDVHHQRLDQVGILLVHSLKVEALDTREREAIFDVVEDVAVHAAPDPLGKVAIQLLGQVEIGETAVSGVEQVHILHGLMDHVVIFRLQFRAAVHKQELDEAIEKLDIAFRRLQRERIHARPVFADLVYLSAIELDDALIASTDIEDVGEAVVLLLVRDGHIAMHALPISVVAPEKSIVPCA